MGLGMPSVGVLLLDQSPEHRRGADSAALQIADVTASALCIGLAGVLVAAATAGLVSLPAAIVASVAVFTLVALLGVAVAGRAAAPGSRGRAPPARLPWRRHEHRSTWTTRRPRRCCPRCWPP